MISEIPRPDVAELARRIRLHCLRMARESQGPHIGSALSVADILAVLYGQVMRFDPVHPEMSGRDRFILSKGHGAMALYATLAEVGYFPIGELRRYCQDGSPLAGHASAAVPGVEVSTGSLGHALSVLSGMAFIAKGDDNAKHRYFGVLSDGECNEGAVWEAALFAAHHRLSNLTVVVDWNGIQGFGPTSQVLDMEDFRKKWESFGWDAEEGDGHDCAWLARALHGVGDRPRVILARTIKGKGVSFMEGHLEWHYRAPSRSQWLRAQLELGGPP